MCWLFDLDHLDEPPSKKGSPPGSSLRIDCWADSFALWRITEPGWEMQALNYSLASVLF